MADFADWLQTNMDTLVGAALAELSQDEIQQIHVTDAVTEFYRGVYKSAHTHDLQPLYEILESWVSAQSAPTEGELTRLVPVAIKLKQVNSHHVIRLCTIAETVELLEAMDKVYDPAIIYLTNLEADALLKGMRRELTAAQAELERLDKSKSDFIEVAAHELRTPITLVEGYSKMLRTSVAGFDNDPSVTPLLYGIEGGVKRLREIIRDMLDVSLISLGMIELHMQPTWLTQLIDALEYAVEGPLAERELELIVEYDTIPKPPILADPERLLQVFEKIVFNAIKYTPDGGTIVVTARQLTSFTDIMVIDNGIGIDPDNLTRIFGMFASVGDSSLHSSGKTKFRGGGPGLGLFISKGIVEAHGGNIWVESPGYDEVALPGSTFHIMVPMRSVQMDDSLVSLTSQDE